jgi:hypothetical protein
LYNIGRNQSEKAKLLIENEFGLVTAEMKRLAREEKEKIDGVQRIQYGEKAISRSISRVLEHVTENYHYTSQHASVKIQWQLIRNSENLERARTKLGWEGIEMVLRLDKNGICKEVNYVDFKSRCVFIGIELGEKCDVHAIRQVQERQQAYERTHHTQELKQIPQRRHSLHR